MNTTGCKSHDGQSHYPSIVAAGVLFAFLWLNLQHHAGAVEQLSVNVSGSIRAYFKHRQVREATEENAGSWQALLERAGT
jgi:hypothetical protein